MKSKTKSLEKGGGGQNFPLNIPADPSDQSPEMDRHAFIQRLKDTAKGSKKGLFIGVCAFGVIILAVTLSSKAHETVKLTSTKAAVDPASPSDDVSDETPTRTVQKPSIEANGEAKAGFGTDFTAGIQAIFKPVTRAIASVQDKIDDLRVALEERDRLKLENTHLRLRLESAQFDCRVQNAALLTSELGKKLATETGSKLGRALASLDYRLPNDLLPPQLYTLGLTYFQDKEFEKSAVIMTTLTDLEDNATYRTAKAYVLNGVSWYHLDNFEVAKKNFEAAIALPENPENLPYQAQARLWSGIVAERMHDHADSQKLLREVVDHHPHSMEAEWVNGSQQSKEVNRATASEE